MKKQNLATISLNLLSIMKRACLMKPQGEIEKISSISALSNVCVS
jgi:hypothetical protein